MKGKIAIFFGANYPNEGLAGVSRIQDMFKYITKYEKHLISAGKDPLREDTFFEKIYIVGQHRPGLSMGSILANAYFVVKAILRFLRKNRKFKYKVIYATSPPFFPVLAAVICGKLTKTPVIADVRDPWATGLALQGFTSKSLVYKIASILERFGYNSTTRTIAVTNGLVKLIQENFGIPIEKINIVPNAADTEVFKPHDKSASRKRLGLPRDGLILIYQGSFASYHNITGLVSTFSKFLVNGEKEDIYLMLVGGKKGELGEWGGNLKDHLLLKERVPRNKIPYFISASDIGIVPLKRTKYSRYMIPLKIYEYAACCRPVLLYGGSEEAEQFIKDFGIGVSSTEKVNSFKQAIEMLTENYEKYQQNSRVMTERINRRNSARVLEDIIDEI